MAIITIQTIIHAVKLLVTTINQPTVELRKIKSHENHKKPQIHVLEFLWKNKVQAIRFQTVKSQNPILKSQGKFIQMVNNSTNNKLRQIIFCCNTCLRKALVMLPTHSNAHAKKINDFLLGTLRNDFRSLLITIFQI